MANGLYTSFKNALLNKELDLDTDTLIVALLDNTYTVDLANDSDYTTACSAAEISAGTLLGTTITDEVFNANDFEFTNVVHPNPGASVVIYHQSTDKLIVYFDTDSGGGAITTPATGEDFNVEWNASGIFSL